MKRLIILLACLSTPAAVAGCGGGSGSSASLSKEDYEQQMQALGSKLDKGLEPAVSDSEDTEAIARELRATADLLEETSSGLDSIEPPDDVADAHQAMIDNVAAAATRIHEFSDNVENVPIVELAFSLLDFFENGKEFGKLDSAVAAINAKGYDIGGSWSSDG